jgi:uncharacterized protein (DUF2062 family)
MIRVTRDALRRGLDTLLHTHDTPRRTAAAFALGVFWGFSPPLGLHTILGLACAFALSLNRVATLLGIYSNLPWLLVPYYMLATVVGAAIIGAELAPGLLTEFRDLLEHFSLSQARQLADRLAPLFWSYLVGSTVGAIMLATVAYQASLAFIIAHRRRRERVKASHNDSSVI